MADAVFTTHDLTGGDVPALFIRFLRKCMKSLSRKTVNYVGQSTDEYNFRNRYRGLAVVISIEMFDDPLLVRRSYVDDELKKTYKIFNDLGFLVIQFKDLSCKEIYEVLSCAASLDSFHNKADAFACVLASHGGEYVDEKVAENPSSPKHRQHVIFGRDGPVCTKQLLDLFSDSDCRSLKGKPRLFFIQACRAVIGADENNRLDQGVEVKFVGNETRRASRKRKPQDRTEGDTQACSDPPQESNTVGGSNTTEETISVNTSEDLEVENEEDRDILFNLSKIDIEEGYFKRIKTFVTKILKRYNPKSQEPILHVTDILSNMDTLIMYATASGKASYGRLDEGGWMLLSLYEVMDSYTKLEEIDIVYMLTEVIRRVSMKSTSNGLKAAAGIEHRLCKDVVFRPKYKDSS